MVKGVTARALLSIGRTCLRLWGYSLVDEIVWVKTDKLGRLRRGGKTGHWLNHAKEHCLVGIKGDVSFAKQMLDSDVIVSTPRELSRKPDEIYRIIDRLVPNGRKVSLLFVLLENWELIANVFGCCCKNQRLSCLVGRIMFGLVGWQLEINWAIRTQLILNWKKPENLQTQIHQNDLSLLLLSLFEKKNDGILFLIQLAVDLPSILERSEAIALKRASSADSADWIVNWRFWGLPLQTCLILPTASRFCCSSPSRNSNESSKFNAFIGCTLNKDRSWLPSTVISTSFSFKELDEAVFDKFLRT